MKKGESGFTIIEVLVAIFISAIIVTGAGMTTIQIIKGSQHSSDWTTAIRQAQNVGYWVSYDALMAQTITIGDDPETGDDEFIIVAWKDWESGDTHDIRYVWLDSADSLKKLSRKQVTKDKDGVEIGNKTTFVADNIYTATLSWQDGAWTLSVETHSGDKSVSREYKINQRLDI